MNYIVVEYQTTAGASSLEPDTTSVLTNVYASRSEAEQKYHLILSAAAVSGLKYHGAMLMDAIGNILKVDHYPEYVPLETE